MQSCAQLEEELWARIGALAGSRAITGGQQANLTFSMWEFDNADFGLALLHSHFLTLSIRAQSRSYESGDHCKEDQVFYLSVARPMPSHKLFHALV